MLAFGLTVNSIISVLFGDNAEMIGDTLAKETEILLSEYAFLSSRRFWNIDFLIRTNWGSIVLKYFVLVFVARSQNYYEF